MRTGAILHHYSTYNRLFEMNDQLKQEIHMLCHEAFKELESLENTPTYEPNPKAISPIDKLQKLRGILRNYAAQCDELELKIIEDDGTDK